MAKINLKDKIFIEGIANDGVSRLLPTGVCCLYQGKTSEIPEELAKECAAPLYLNYGTTNPTPWGWDSYNDNSVKNTSIQSIQSACSEEYCIIYKE